ncbi:hypothetical protein GGR56DRAFT_661999 [Xylariaceae sp. FL0804]|nr:hypothetical protein GGR56DRAFT_661999 [Xylariaceae sp. FL0804]
MQPKPAIAALVLATIGTVKACPFHAGAQEQSEVAVNKQQYPVGSRTRTAIQDIRVYSVYSGATFSHARTICFDAGYIVDTESCLEAATIINGTGKFLIPGLIDSHLHLTDVASLLENYTSYGCTSAMHINYANYTQYHLNAEQPGLAKFFYAGGSAVGNGSMHAKQQATRPADTFIYPDTNVTEFASWALNNGSDYIKITAELFGPSLEQQIEMVRTAHADYDRQSITQASSVAAYGQAADSLADGIQHVPDNGLLGDDVVKQIKAQNQYITPTINVFEYAYSSTTLQSYFGVTGSPNRTLAHAHANARKLYGAGISLLAGTDSVGVLTFNGSSVAVPWGLTLHQELENFINILGMSPAEAINSATSVPARWHRVLDRGFIEVGKRADLVMLNSDPLVDITNTRDIERI